MAKQPKKTKKEKRQRQEKSRQRRRELEKLKYEIESDETFDFIAGYTEGGAPYGITFKELDEIEKLEKLDF